MIHKLTLTKRVPHFGSQSVRKRTRDNCRACSSDHKTVSVFSWSILNTIQFKNNVDGYNLLDHVQAINLVTVETDQSKQLDAIIERLLIRTTLTGPLLKFEPPSRSSEI